MAAIPTWLLGKHVTAFTLTGQAVASDGTLSDATGAGVQPLLGCWDEIEMESTPELEEISSADSSRANNVIVKNSTRFRFTQILQNTKPAAAATDTKANPLAHIAITYDYIKLVLTRGAVTAEDTWTFYGVRGSYSESIRKGKSTASLTLEMIDPAGTNPTYG